MVYFYYQDRIMDYCALSDIQTFTHLTYGTTTKPTSTEVSAIISDVSDRIDLYLKAVGFVPPPTDTANHPTHGLVR